MRQSKMTLEQMCSHLVKVFANEKKTKDYNTARVMYEGWFGAPGDPMFPVSRYALVENYGEEMVQAAERAARAEIEESRRMYEDSEWPALFAAADAHEAAGSPVPAVGAYIWGEGSGLGCQSCKGFREEMYNLLYRAQKSAPRCLLYVAKVFPVSAEELDRAELPDEICAGGDCPGGYSQENDERITRIAPRNLFCRRVGVVTDGARYYMISGGYTHADYVYFPSGWRSMYAPAVQAITEAEEAKKAAEEAAAAAKHAEMLARYEARCKKWAPLMRPVGDLMAAVETAQGETERKAAKRKLNAARRANILAMCRHAFPGVKFSLKRHDYWGCAWILTYKDGPTEEAFKAATDLHLFVTYRDRFDGEEDYAYTEDVAADFRGFAEKYMGDDYEARGVKVEREMSEETRAAIEARVIEAFPELADKRADIDRDDMTDEQRGKIQAIVGGEDIGKWRYYHCSTIVDETFKRTDYTPAPTKKKSKAA